MSPVIIDRVTIFYFVSSCEIFQRYVGEICEKYERMREILFYSHSSLIFHYTEFVASISR